MDPLDHFADISDSFGEAFFFSRETKSELKDEEGPLSLASRPWTLLTLMRVGLPLGALDTRFCTGCGAAMDGFGDHVLSCHKLGICARHNEVRNELAGICSELNLRVEVEQDTDGSSFRPGDVLVHGLVDEPLAVDVDVVHTPWSFADGFVKT